MGGPDPFTDRKLRAERAFGEIIQIPRLDNHVEKIGY